MSELRFMNLANKKLEKQRSVIANLKKKNRRLTKALKEIAVYENKDLDYFLTSSILRKVSDEYTPFDWVIQQIRVARNALESKK